MNRRLISAIALATVAATAGNIEVPKTAVQEAGVQPSSPGVKDQQGAPPSQPITISQARAPFIPLTNVPFIRRADPIWLGRPRDIYGKPWGSRRYRQS